MRFMATDVVHATGGTLSGKNAHLSGAGFDSRSLAMGQLFVPVVGGRDGHDFIDDALANGAGAYLTSRAPRRGTAIVVPDTLEALRALARWARTRLAGRLGHRVVGITGSVGKTTTKDFAAAALGATLTVAASARSFNNDLGVPITVLNAPDNVEALVLEMGMRGHGEITRLTEVGMPRIGVVTAVAEAHSALLDNLDGIARAKGELVEALPGDGVAILNADDDRVAAMRHRTSARVLTYGEAPSADVRILALELDTRAHATVRLDSPWGAVTMTLPIAGRHSAGNAAAAIAVAGECGVDVALAARAIATAPMSPSRMSIRTTGRGATLVDDAYNANPASMAAALETLAALPARRRVAFLGVMAELKDPEIAHRAVAAMARRHGIQVVPVETNLYGLDAESLQSALLMVGEFGDGDAVLVKGSRVAGLERLTQAFV